MHKRKPHHITSRNVYKSESHLILAMQRKKNKLKIENERAFKYFIVIVFVFIVQLGFIDNHGRYARDDSSASDDGGDSQSTVFIIGSGDYLNQTPSATTQCAPTSVVTVTSVPLLTNCLVTTQSNNNIAVTSNPTNFSNLTSAHSVNVLSAPSNQIERLVFATNIVFSFIHVIYSRFFSDFTFSSQNTQIFSLVIYYH